MKYFRLIISTLALLALATPAAAQKLSLAEISAYLNNMRTAQAEFTQINDDGSISTGEIFISRPGRIRFDERGSGEFDEGWIRLLVHSHPDCLPIDEIEPGFSSPLSVCMEFPTPPFGPILLRR